MDQVIEQNGQRITPKHTLSLSVRRHQYDPITKLAASAMTPIFLHTLSAVHCLRIKAIDGG